jgi:hypothetical protein
MRTARCHGRACRATAHQDGRARRPARGRSERRAKTSRANVRVAISGREEDSRHLAEIHTAVDDVRLALAQLDAKQQDNISDGDEY